MNARRDRAAEAWLRAQHDHDWYIGDATEAEWRRAYAAVDAPDEVNEGET